MRFRCISIEPSLDEGSLEVTEVAQGWEVFRTSFDRGMWFLLLKQETETASKTAKHPDEADEEER